MTTALISVADKSGVLDLARGLHAAGVQLLSTGGTARLLQENGLPVTEVVERTGFPEMLDGRVKTLHPAIHAGLLARRDLPGHMAALQQQGIGAIDLLVVNLYPFEATVARPGCTLADAIENIDIGGPAMIRSAAKNWRDVAVLTDPAQYADVLAELQSGGLSLQTRFALATAAFNRISDYAAAISNYLSALAAGDAVDSQTPQRQHFPGQLNAHWVKVQDLRYGENPHQQAAFYRNGKVAGGTLAAAEQLHGKALSYNNLADADAAWRCVRQWQEPACVIVKHAAPCGVAVADGALPAYRKALKTDPVSAFGGIIAFNVAVDADAAAAVAEQFAEVVIAPDFSPEALQLLEKKANLRLLRIGMDAADGPLPLDADWQFQRVGGGMLVQTADARELAAEDLQVVTQEQPSPEQLADLLFAWKVVRFVKSNAIVFCKDGMTLGLGSGQPSRLDSARIASSKAAQAGLSLHGSAVASDAFFPFRDGLDVVAEHGASSVIQPGGSRRDQEVIDAANEHGIALVFTGVRHFRH